MRTKSVLAASALVAVVAAIGWAAYSTIVAAGQAPDFAAVRFTGSAACESCHDDRHASWARTFHRTMTQTATAATVQGDFNGVALNYGGVSVIPQQDGEQFWFEYRQAGSGELLNRLPVLRTVGSHRYQQYLTQEPVGDGTYYRLHYLWHNLDQQWVRVNNAFLHGDDLPFDQMVSVWDHNCIFCHNTGPEPNIQNFDELVARARRGEPVNAANDATYRSSVAELGIGCESCHAPGQAHVDANQSVFRRWVLKLSGSGDATIVNPEKLDAQRSTQICGQCHAQRVPKTDALLRQWLDDGPTYRAGMNLNEHVSPIWDWTPSPARDNPDLYRDRFWADGSPRLSAYEYQGLLQSRCYTEAQLSCIDCHAMHGGDPAGMISERNRGNAPCLDCHQQFAEPAGLVEHTQHQPDSQASNCYACHMPYATYGVMTTHRTHRIERPDPGKSAAAGKPNACTNCHQDRSLQWVANELRQRWGWQGELHTRLDGAPLAIADGYAQLLAGNAVQKAIAAVEAGKDQGLPASQRAQLLPALLALLDDDYPSSRRFAQHSIASISRALNQAGLKNELESALADYDWQATSQVRAPARARIDAAWAQLQATLPAPSSELPLNEQWRPDQAAWAQLLEIGARQDRQISIGE